MLPRSRRFTRDFKLKVLREAETGTRPSELARKYELHPRLISKWRKQLYEEGERAFTKGPVAGAESSTVAQLERKIGQQTMEISFLKKVLQRLETRLRSMPKNGTSS
jgi:transposase